MHVDFLTPRFKLPSDFVSTWTEDFLIRYIRSQRGISDSAPPKHLSLEASPGI